jgi:enolase-phosphatase E1
LRTILTDIEGTTSSIAFVHQVLFPYARRALPGFVATHARDPEVRRWLDAVAVELGTACDVGVIVETLLGWIDTDRKHTALKALQGMLWREGYARGDYLAHVYPDAAAALRRWHGQGHPLAVYSSGSIEAQQLLFGHSQAGDLSPLFSAWFDTTSGGKREAASYSRIADALGTHPGELLFLSDVVAELDAAREAGLATTLVDRLEDYPQPRLGDAAHGHVRVTGFDAITP